MTERDDIETELPDAGLAGLTAVIFDEEQHRLEEHTDDEVLLPDDLLPGVGGELMTMREGLRSGGRIMIVLLIALTMLEEFDRVAMLVLGPDIQDSLHVSDTVLLGLLSFGGVVLVLSTLPFAWLADRRSRTSVLAGASAVWVLFSAFTGSVANSFQMGLARAGTGFGGAARIPISPSLIADQYPIGVRSRMFAAEAIGRPLGQVIGPFAVGLIVLIAGGQSSDWRWPLA